MASHGFTFTFDGNESECTKFGLGGLKSTLQIPANASALQHPPSIWGYNVGDEPGTAQFPVFTKAFTAIQQNAPSKMGFANLLETYCPPLSLSANPAGKPGSPVPTPGKICVIQTLQITPNYGSIYDRFIPWSR